MNVHEYEVLKDKVLNGDEDSLMTLANYYQYGTFIEITPDKKRAYSLYEEAAKRNNLTAQKIVGNAYMDGFIVKRDKQKAIDWFKKASLQGDTYSIKMIERLEGQENE